MNKYDFVLDVLTYRGVDPDCATSIEMAHHALPYNFYTVYRTGLPVDIARSIEATRFLQGEKAPYKFTDRMIFLDDDMVFGWRDLARLNAHLDDKNLIAGIYPNRAGLQIMCKGFDGFLKPDGGLQKAMYASTGFMGFTRNLLSVVVKKLNLPLLNKGEWNECYPFFTFVCTEDDNQKNAFLGEDWEFSRKVRNAGEAVWVDCSIQLQHVGRFLHNCQNAKLEVEIPVQAVGGN